MECDITEAEVEIRKKTQGIAAVNSVIEEIKQDILKDINSNIISSIFYTIDFHRNKIIRDKGIWTNEAYLRDQLNIFGIDVVYKNFEISF